MELKVERIYTKPTDLEGYRILVDRLWPRGVSKVNTKLDLWAKEIGPTKELRQWFNHEPEKFPEFKKRYLLEINANAYAPEILNTIQKTLQDQNVILLYGAKDPQYNQAVVLLAWLRQELKIEK